MTGPAGAATQQALARDATSPRILKRDSFGTVSALTLADGRRIVRRDLSTVRWPLRPIARRLAAREARAMRALEGLEGVPRLLSWDGLRLDRSLIEGLPMYEARPRDPRWFRAAWHLLRELHRRGVVHNDLAKEANWLVTESGAPAVIDFQLARIGDPRRPFLRMLAREDLRHLLKHKRSYCPQALTPVEQRLLKRRGWLGRWWMATGKPLYRLITRRLLGWRDNEGRGLRP